MHGRMRVFGVVIALMVLIAFASPTSLSKRRDLGLKRGSVTIVRDEFGVPHVYGSTLESVWFGVGYSQGQDRLWQAEVFRRSATGTSAEIFGSSAVANDRMARILFGPSERRQ